MVQAPRGKLLGKWLAWSFKEDQANLSSVGGKGDSKSQVPTEQVGIRIIQGIHLLCT